MFVYNNIAHRCLLVSSLRPTLTPAPQHNALAYSLFYSNTMSTTSQPATDPSSPQWLEEHLHTLLNSPYIHFPVGQLGGRRMGHGPVDLFSTRFNNFFTKGATGVVNGKDVDRAALKDTLLALQSKWNPATAKFAAVDDATQAQVRRALSSVGQPAPDARSNVHSARNPVELHPKERRSGSRSEGISIGDRRRWCTPHQPAHAVRRRCPVHKVTQNACMNIIDLSTCCTVQCILFALQSHVLAQDFPSSRRSLWHRLWYIHWRLYPTVGSQRRYASGSLRRFCVTTQYGTPVCGTVQNHIKRPFRMDVDTLMLLTVNDCSHHDPSKPRS
ncbi:hypothetical protein AcW1_001414 [Taiwanofungus camphoratus]|nr:hypothetical protein AcW1_001414 [Antrodia cinnamomea]